MNGTSGFMALMYHELLAPGQHPCEDTPGYRRYVLSRQEFSQQLDLLTSAEMTGLALGSLVATLPRDPSSPAVAITFDDGCASDLEHAAPLLAARGFGATFFIVPGFLGRRGYLTAPGVRELAAAGFEIGSHGLTHALLSHLPPQELARELIDSRARLEDVSGVGVHLLSCPGGRWSPLVASVARSAGYGIVATSAIGLNTVQTPLECLRRLAIRPGLPAGRFLQYCRGEHLWPQRLRSGFLHMVRRVIGERRFQAIHQQSGSI